MKKSKRLGQHFLVNKEKIKKIIAALELGDGDAVIEIGAGHGELTEEIKNPRTRTSSVRGRQKSKIKIIAIEKDKKLFKKLVNSNWKLETENIEIIQGDALKILPKLFTNYQLPISNYKLVGNIPYYITGRMLRVIGELKNKPQITILTLQKEVALRLTAEPPKMNILAASVQFWAKPEIVDFISKKDFRPQPKVDSAIIKLTPRNWKLENSNSNYQLLITNYYKLIKILFKQPRKTILNNLEKTSQAPKSELSRKLEQIGINPQDRPQNLGVELIKKLSQMLYNDE